MPDQFGQGITNAAARTGADAPNVLWVFADDLSPWMPMYGDDTVETPHLESLADRGVQLDRLYATSPVCTPSRSAVVTGMYQTTIGAHNHYSSFQEWRGVEMEQWDPTHLGVRTIMEQFRSAGYYTFNVGKNHYNFVDRDEMLFDHHWTEAGHWRGDAAPGWSRRDEGQPFFGQIQLAGGKTNELDERLDAVDPADVDVPPYYPDHEVIRREIAHHYDTIQETDRLLGEITDRLAAADLLQDTIVWFFADHGMTLPRHKQFCYEGGIHVPGVVAGPGIPSGEAYRGLVSGIDIAPTSLAAAGMDVPRHMQGGDIFTPDFEREYVVAARDRCDYTIDRIRAVVTDRYKLIRNFMTDRPYLQPQYRDGRDYLEILRELDGADELDPIQSRFVSADRPAEELYDLAQDPHETENLVHSTATNDQEALARLRHHLADWLLETDDRGQSPSSDAALSAALERWDDDAVNEEYDRVR